MSDTSTNQPERLGAGEEEALSSQIEELLRSVDATLERAARVIEDGDDDGAGQFAADESDPEIDRLAEEMVAEARGRVAVEAPASAEAPSAAKEPADSQAVEPEAAMTPSAIRGDGREAAATETELDESPDDVAALAAEINELTSAGPVKRRSWDDSGASTPVAAPPSSAQDLDGLDEAIAGEADRRPAAEFDVDPERFERHESREGGATREGAEGEHESDESADRDAIAGLAAGPERPGPPARSASEDAGSPEANEAQPVAARPSTTPASPTSFERSAQGSSKIVKMATDDVIGPLENSNARRADKTLSPAAPLDLEGGADESGEFSETEAAKTLWSSIKARIEASVPHLRQALGGMKRVLSVMNRPWRRIAPAHQIAILFFTTGTITIAIVAWLVVASRIF